jgi:hypothetical protein
VDTISNWGVSEKKEDIDGIGVRIDENGFAIDLERVREGLAGVRNDVVSDFEAVDVGLILLITAEGIAEDVGGKTKEREKQEKRRERGPIIE